MSESVADRLASLPVFQGVPRQELEWLAAHGEVREVRAGLVMSNLGEPVDEMWIIFSGRAGFHQQRGGASRKMMQAGAGQVAGALPYSRTLRSPGKVVIEEDTTAFVVHRDHFPVITRDLPGVTAALVHRMLDRASEFRSVQLNDERLASLSRLASGFAHELNNPASAAARTAQAMAVLIREQERAARALAAARLAEDHLAAVDGLRSECRQAPRPRTALEAADREDEIADWLTDHSLGVDDAETISASDVSLAALDRVARVLPREALGIAIRWVATSCAAGMAAQQIEAATSRIHHLVAAVKGFTFMDRHGVPEDVDIARGLADTLAMLEGKARAKSATVTLETAEGLPRLHGFGSELNQVWEKLVDNAIDAVGDRGQVTITATTRGESILVRVADDGPGIPEEIRTRVFDPFFTTKPIGLGTGLGLDLARRIVIQHGGDIGFTSQPGRTVFRVMLPVSGAPGAIPA